MSASLFVAIGAGVAVLTGIGAGLGIGKATGSAVDASITSWLCTCRGNRYLRFRYCITYHSFLKIMITCCNYYI